jgi:hypothetical protein
MLTGLLRPDYFSGDASVYGSSVLYEMDGIRRSMGVCPQVCLDDILYIILYMGGRIRIIHGYVQQNVYYILIYI